jgi:hypothetical protein
MQQYKDSFQSTDSANVIGKNTRDGKNANPDTRKKVETLQRLSYNTQQCQIVGNSPQSPAPGSFRRPRFQSSGQSLGGQQYFTFRQSQSNSRFRASSAPVGQRQYTYPTKKT